jgi:hypothetical protein
LILAEKLGINGSNKADKNLKKFKKIPITTLDLPLSKLALSQGA